MKNGIKKKIKHAVSFLLHGEPDVITAKVVGMAPSELLKGRCALITGGTSGIGYSIAKAFLNAGASVIITGRTRKRLDEAVAKMGCEGRVYSFVMDNTKVQTFKTTFQKMLDTVKMGGGKMY